MNNENEFNISNDNNFSTHTFNRKNKGTNIIVPFISGIAGAAITIGVCFGVPTIRKTIIGNTKSSYVTTSAPTEISAVNIADYSNTAVSVAEKVLPSVVGIEVTYKVNSIFGTSSGTASGSGIIISEDGYIVTNNHVISESSSSSYYAVSEATSIQISLYGDDTKYDAQIIGTDETTDIAILKIEKTGLTAAELGDSTILKTGEFVMAVGNPVGMDYSVTSGIVSALNREVTAEGTTYTAIQTDAAINSGNSGGALVNANGQVIGINTLKLSGSDIEGIGFAIPISSITNVMNQLIEYKEVKRPFVGVSGTSVGETTAKRYNIPNGIYVESIIENSPAEKAGLQIGDIITKFEGNEVTSVTEMNKYKNTYNIGDTVTLTVYRNKEEIEVKVTLAETPAETTTSTESSSSNSSNSQNNKNDSSRQTPSDSYDEYYYSGSIWDLFR